MSAAKERVAAVGRHLLPVPRPAAPSPDWTGAEADLRAAFPASQLSFDLETRDKHGQSFGSLLPSSPPAAIVHAESTEDVVRLVTICTTRGIVLIPTGGRTALEGQFQATCCNPTPAGERGSAFRAQAGAATSLPRRVERPTVHVSLSRMQRITLFEQDFQAIVGPGVGWKSLNEHLAESGVKLFFPVGPDTTPPRCDTGTDASLFARRWIPLPEASLAEWLALRVVGQTRSAMAPSAPSGSSR